MKGYEKETMGWLKYLLNSTILMFFSFFNQIHIEKARITLFFSDFQLEMKHGAQYESAKKNR